MGGAYVCMAQRGTVSHGPVTAGREEDYQRVEIADGPFKSPNASNGMAKVKIKPGTQNENAKLAPQALSSFLCSVRGRKTL